jgi:DNA-binding CsgD family transcriptional regulator
MGHLLEIVKRRLNPGILIFDMNNRLSYANEEALEILPTLQNKKKLTKKSPIPDEIHNLCDQLKRNLVDTKKTEIICSIIENPSGFSCSLRAFFLRGGGESLPTHIMVLIERIAEKREGDFEKASRDFNLSRREAEVLRLLCDGNTNKGIAEKLFISEYTVKDHIKKIMEKMGVKSRSEIIALMK